MTDDVCSGMDEQRGGDEETVQGMNEASRLGGPVRSPFLTDASNNTAQLPLFVYALDVDTLTVARVAIEVKYECERSGSNACLGEDGKKARALVSPAPLEQNTSEGGRRPCSQTGCSHRRGAPSCGGSKHRAMVEVGTRRCRQWEDQCIAIGVERL